MAPQEKKELEPPVTEDVAFPRSFEDAERWSFPEALIVLARQKFRVLAVVAVVFLLSVGVAFFPQSLTATTQIMPPQQNQSIGSAMLDQLGSLSGLAGAVTGKDLLRSPGDIYIAMLQSRTVADRIIDRLNLMSAYHITDREVALKRLKSITETKAGKGGVITISVSDRDPDRAARIANAYIEELDKLTKTLAVTDAGRRRIFFEREAKTASEQLEAAEVDLKKTQESTGIIQMDSQSRVMLQAYEDLKAAATAKELEIESMRSFAAAENPDLVRAQRELEALRAKIATMEKGQGGPPIGDIALEKIPEKALKYYDKLREVTYRTSLLQLLLKQYEIARIDEAKDAALIQVLDPAIPPERRYWRSRLIIMLVGVFSGLFLAIVYVLVLERIQRAREDPQFAAQLQLFNFYLKHR